MPINSVYKTLPVAIFLLVPPLAFPQSVRYQNQVIGSRGMPIPNAFVAVCTQPANVSTQPCSPLATLGTSTSTTSGGQNPTNADSNGNFFFYAAPGKYTVQIYSPQITPPGFVQPDTLLACDPSASCTISGSPTFSAPIISTVATGTAPLVIASTTVVPNLNAQLHNGLTAPASAIVGINDSQTLTNKTLTSATLTTPAINGASTGTGVQGTDSKLLTSGTVSGTAVALCTDANGGATTSGCPGGASGFKIECTSLTPVTVANTVTKTALIATCTIPANEIGAGQWFYVDAFGILGDTAAPSLTIELDLDIVTVCSWSPSLAAANNQPWALHGWFNGITTGASGSVSGCSIQWMSSASGGGGSAGNLSLVAADTTGVAAPPQTVSVDTTVSHVLQLKVTWGVANTSNTITQNNLIVHRLN